MIERRKMAAFFLKLFISLILTFSFKPALSFDDMGGAKLSRQLKFLENTFAQATRKGFLISSKTVRWERSYTAIYSSLAIGGLAVHFTSGDRSTSFTSGLITIQSTFGAWDMLFNRFYPKMDLALFNELPEGHKKLKLGLKRHEIFWLADYFQKAVQELLPLIDSLDDEAPIKSKISKIFMDAVKQMNKYVQLTRSI